MEELVLESRPSRVVLRRQDAFEAAAWKAPSGRRFDSRPANDVEPQDGGLFEIASEPAEPPVVEAAPFPPLVASRWLIAAGGCVAAALLGALAGGFLAY